MLDDALQLLLFRWGFIWNAPLVALFSLSGLPTRTNVGKIAGAVVFLEDIKQCILLFKPNAEPVILHCLKFNVYAKWLLTMIFEIR